MAGDVGGYALYQNGYVKGGDGTGVCRKYCSAGVSWPAGASGVVRAVFQGAADSAFRRPGRAWYFAILLGSGGGSGSGRSHDPLGRGHPGRATAITGTIYSLAPRGRGLGGGGAA